MIEAIVNSENTHQVAMVQEEITIHGHTHTPNIYQYDDRLFHCLYQQAGYAVELLEADYARKHFVFNIRGKVVTVQLKDKLDRLVEKLGMAQATEAIVKEIVAPMPGLIVKLSVETGQAIAQGDSVLTLEAMKMENVIKSPVDGVVHAIHVNTGESVDKNQVLLSFE